MIKRYSKEAVLPLLLEPRFSRLSSFQKDWSGWSIDYVSSLGSSETVLYRLRPAPGFSLGKISPGPTAIACNSTSNGAFVAWFTSWGTDTDFVWESLAAHTPLAGYNFALSACDKSMKWQQALQIFSLLESKLLQANLSLGRLGRLGPCTKRLGRDELMPEHVRIQHHYRIL